MILLSPSSSSPTGCRRRHRLPGTHPLPPLARSMLPAISGDIRGHAFGDVFGLSSLLEQPRGDHTHLNFLATLIGGLDSLLHLGRHAGTITISIGASESRRKGTSRNLSSPFMLPVFFIHEYNKAMFAFCTSDCNTCRKCSTCASAVGSRWCGLTSFNPPLAGSIGYNTHGRCLIVVCIPYRFKFTPCGNCIEEAMELLMISPQEKATSSQS